MLQFEEKNALRARLQDDLSSLTGGTLPDHIFEILLDYVVSMVRPDYSRATVQWDALPANVRSDLRESWSGEGNLDELEKTMSAEIGRRTPDEVFELWTEWNGIVNWSRTIRNALDGIRAASSVFRGVSASQPSGPQE
jgi:hypothetical protein